ncbi:MAG: branched-chain amino acid ABC transporter permease [Planctomycetota bacterium]
MRHGQALLDGEDELVVATVGADPRRIKVVVFGISAAFAFSTGVVYASYASSIDPTTFDVSISIQILMMIIGGGLGSVTGAVVGASLLVALPEALRFVGVPGGATANIRQIILGVFVVAMMVARPRGLFGGYSVVNRR